MYKPAQARHIRRELALFHPLAQQLAEDASEILVPGIGQEAARVCDHAEEIIQRAHGLYTFLAENGYHPLVTNETVRSQTVIAVEAEKEVITKVKAGAKQAGLQLGNGYGAWKETTFRIANFPAIDVTDISLLRNFLYSISHK